VWGRKVQDESGISFCARRQGRYSEINGLYQTDTGAKMKDIPGPKDVNNLSIKEKM